METQTLISCSDLVPGPLHQRYNGAGLDLEISKGEIVCIIGPDYCGKSEWLAALGGITHPSRGRLQLLDAEPGSFNKEDWTRIRMRLAYLDSETTILSAANARQNVMLPARYHRLSPQSASLEAVSKLLDQLGVPDQLSLPAYIRPDQRYRIAIARALILDPDALLLDTPFENLGMHSRREFQTLLVNRVREQQMSLMIVTHDIDFVVEHSDKILFASLDGMHRFDTADDMRQCELYAVKNFLSKYSVL